MDFPVKWYSSAMQGAPTLGDSTEGALAALLKAVLVTGFGNLTVNSLTWDAALGWAVATIDAGHSYLKDSVIAISGASPSGYNGEHRVMKVSATKVWFALDGGDPGIAASGTITIKTPGLGWVITHESANGQVVIVRSPELVDAYPVSLRIDNTAFSGWVGTTYLGYLAKVAMVEDVVDINTYTLIYEHRWPATGRYSDKRWDLIGDGLIFYFLPGYAASSYQQVYSFGYINSIRPGDRYHAVFNHYPTTDPGDNGRRWISSMGTTSNAWGNTYASFDSSSLRQIARPFSQLFGTTPWWLKGLFARFGNGFNVPNGPDNGLYMSADPIMVMETGNHLRGYMPGLICPFSTVAAWDRKNFENLPALPGKQLRFVRVGFDESPNGGTTLMGFDLTGPWR